MKHNANLTDKYCMECFPELEQKYGIDVLYEASSYGSYVFHEDYFNFWVSEDVKSNQDLKRVANYIEYLASSPNHHLQNLAQIAIIEGLINLNFIAIAPFLKKHSKQLVLKAKNTTNFDEKIWLKNK